MHFCNARMRYHSYTSFPMKPLLCCIDRTGRVSYITTTANRKTSDMRGCCGFLQKLAISRMEGYFRYKAVCIIYCLLQIDNSNIRFVLRSDLLHAIACNF